MVEQGDGHAGLAINHLISHLERAGYLERYPGPAGGTRQVRLTSRGRQLYEHIESVAVSVEAEWARQVGARRLEEMRATLSDLLAAGRTTG